MPKPPKAGPKSGNVVTLERDTSTVSVEETPEGQSAAPPFMPPSPHPAPPQQFEEPERKRKTIKNFFERMRTIPAADWGTRAFIYVYCLEPICDLKMGGETKYLVKLKQPLFDEDPIMIDYGSGKYRLQFVYRKPDADKADQVDTLEIEIVNPKYPPKISQSVWKEDPRNAKWRALLPLEDKPGKANQGADLLETVKTLGQIRKDMREELTPPPPPAQASDVDRFTSMITAFKAIMPQPSSATDNQMLTTIVTLMQSQVQASQQEAKQLRDQVFELIQKRENAPAAPAITLETILDKAETVFPRLQKIIGLGGDKLTEVVHGRPRQWWQELLLDIAPPIIQEAAPVLGTVLSRMAQQPNGAIQQNGYAPAPPTNSPQIAAGTSPPAQPSQENAGTRITAFLQQPAISRPLEKYVRGFIAGTEGSAGKDFAYWLYDGYDMAPLQDARALGLEGLLNIFRSSQSWPLMQPYEAKLREFISDVLAWTETEEEQAPAVKEEAVNVA